MRKLTNISCFIVLAGACSYEETELQHHDFRGTVKIPVEALSVTMIDENNEEFLLENDPRMIGPVYIGAFASIRDDLFDYPHPEMGPVLDDDLPGNTYPYGGTTVGRFDWGCYEELRCKVVTGRFTSYQDVLDFFRDEIRQPVLDQYGTEVTSDLDFRERCYETLFLTSDDEVSFVTPEESEPGFPADDALDFRLEGDFWVADVELSHSFFAGYDDETGPQVWGWVDMPSRTFNYASCDKDAGDFFSYYDEEYNLGTNHQDILNYPGLYIDDGDYVAEDSPMLTSETDTFELILGIRNDD